MAKKMTFYDMKARKKVSVDEDDVEYVVKKTKRGKIKMAKVKSPDSGIMMWKIIGKV